MCEYCRKEGDTIPWPYATRVKTVRGYVTDQAEVQICKACWPLMDAQGSRQHRWLLDREQGLNQATPDFKTGDSR